MIPSPYSRRAVPDGGASAHGDRRQPHGSLLTRCWREMDSNSRFPASHAAREAVRARVSSTPFHHFLFAAGTRFARGGPASHCSPIRGASPCGPLRRALQQAQPNRSAAGVPRRFVVVISHRRTGGAENDAADRHSSDRKLDRPRSGVAKMKTSRASSNLAIRPASDGQPIARG
jgi:hypothetical protein